MHLLVVEDDPRLGRLLKRMLEQDRHVVELVASGRDALEVASSGGIEAIVLDVGLPDMSGFDVARRLRLEGASTPILMLTARDAIDDRVNGLDAGADDYLVKPFAYEELAARLRALDRRASGARRRSKPVLTNGPIVVDEARRHVSVAGKEINLTPRELALLECFLRHPGQVLTREQLLDFAWPYGDFLTPNSVDTYVHYLRDKLGKEASQRIVTVRGVGYRMAAA